MNPIDPRIFIVDDDAAVRDSLALLLDLKGYRTESFDSAEAFLARWQEDWAGCVLLDIRMPGMSGLALQLEFEQRGIRLPVIVISAHGDIAATRAAFKAGAVDFLEKPIDEEALVNAIRAALARDRERCDIDATQAEFDALLGRLTAREREVLDMAVEGWHNREIAAALDISPRTVEVYKARMMEKLRVQRSADLVRFVLTRGQAAGAVER